MKRIGMCLLILFCILGFVACSAENNTDSDTVTKPPVLTLEERKDIYVSYFHYSTEYSTADIEETLEKIHNPQVLTLDEALDVFWTESGIDPAYYLRKTNSNGQVYYRHKISDNSVSAFVNMLYTANDEQSKDVTDIENYGFIVVQSNGWDYIINVDGTVKCIQ